MNKTRIAMIIGMMVVASTFAFGQNSNIWDITLNAHMNETVSVAVGGNVALVDFGAVAPGGTYNSAALAITTTWVLRGSRNSVNVYAYFADPTGADAMNNGMCPSANCYQIPSSAILGSTNGGGSWTAFNTAVGAPFNGMGLALPAHAITAANRNSNATDNLILQLNLTPAANFAQMTADTYSGTLHIAAQAVN